MTRESMLSSLLSGNVVVVRPRLILEMFPGDPWYDEPMMQLAHALNGRPPPMPPKEQLDQWCQDNGVRYDILADNGYYRFERVLESLR